MKKQKIAVIFGGMSSEHDVSIASGTSVIKNLIKFLLFYNIYLLNLDNK